MRKKIVMAMVLGMAVMMTACSSGKEKTLSEKDLETMSEKQAEEAIMKFAEEYDKDMGIKKEEPVKEEIKEEETEAEVFDPHKIEQYFSIDPYGKGIFEIFGLDDNFSKIKEGFDFRWAYRADGCQMNMDTGETPEDISQYCLSLVPEEWLYNDYYKEVEEYLADFYGNTEKYVVFESIDETVVFEPEKALIRYEIGQLDDGVTLLYFPLEKYTVEGTVESVMEDKAILPEGEEDENKGFRLDYYETYDINGNKIELQDGQKVKFDLYRTRSQGITNINGYISNLEILQ